MRLPTARVQKTATPDGSAVRTLVAGDGSYRITMTCPAEAHVPAGAKLEVSELREASRAYVSYMGRVSDKLAGGADVSYARLFDISITVDGEKIQPDAPVAVRIELLDEEGPAIADDEELVVAHFAEESPRVPDTVQAQVEGEGADSAVSFEADSFSIYAIVVTHIEKNVLAADGNTYHITVSYTPDAAIPEGTELEVHEVAEESGAYARYLAKASEALGDDLEPRFARFFDISLKKDGTQVQPAAPVSVTVELADALTPDARALHFGTKAEVLDAAAAQPELFDSAVSFEAEGFSVYGIVEVEDAGQTATAFAGDDPDGKTLYLSNKRSSTEYYLIDAQKSATWMDQTAKIALAQAFTFTKVGEGLYTVSCTGEDGATRYLTLSSTALTMGGEPYAFKLTKQNGFWLFQMGDGSNNSINHNDGNGFGRWQNGYSDAGNRIILTEPLVEDPLGLDGRTLGLAVFNNGTNCVGLLDGATTGRRLAGKELLVHGDPLELGRSLFVAKDSSIAQWTFEHLDGYRYYLRSEDGRYLTIDGVAVYLADEPTDDSVLTLEMGARTYAGKVRITNSSGQAINLYGGKAANGFGGYSDRGANEWLSIVKLSDYNEKDFLIYTASKVSVSDTVNVANGKQVVIYTRVWNDETKEYEFYALDHEGRLVRVYESGNVLQWVGHTINNMLWNFTEYYYAGTTTPNYYYELQNDYSGKYLAPQIQGSQTLSESPIGINLGGRRYEGYYTTILAWDDPFYDYAGLRVAGDRLASGPMANAQDFYFAVMEPETDELTTVETLDSKAHGITMRMQDYSGQRYSNYNRDRSQTDVIGDDVWTDNGTPGLLSTNLTDGAYPTTVKAGRSLGELYGSAQEVNHLFLSNTYEESGYFEFNSTKNFAHLNEDGTFTVYNQIGTIEADNKSLNHGQFMPYNDIVAGQFAQMHPTNLTSTTDVELPADDPRKGEKLYSIPYTASREPGVDNNANYFFGMEMEASFMQSPNGLDDWGHDIIFEFSGDDDMWLYVDGELVLDLGGIHKAHVGTVNFRTGRVTMVRNGSTTNVDTTLRALFRQNYQARGMSTAEINARLTELFGPNESDTVFKDYSSHTMKMFYMERGAGSSNLHMRFNLATTEPGTVSLDKAISGTDKQDYASVRFPYQVWYRDGGAGDFKLLEQGANDAFGHNVTYKGTSEPVEYAERDGAYRSVFYLKPGQHADIHLPGEDTEYYIVECGVKSSLYDQVRANDVVLAGTPAGDGTKDYATARAVVSDRKRVTYDNHVDPSALRTLTITKRLFDEQDRELTAEDDPTGFRLRMYLGENLDYYRLDSYYVKDPTGAYCTYEDGAFVSLGKTRFDDLTTAELEKATFTTSQSGAIDKITAGYSVEIRNLLVDTPFKVEERASDIPAGYALKEYRRVEGSYITEEGPQRGRHPRQQRPLHRGPQPARMGSDGRQGMVRCALHERSRPHLPGGVRGWRAA